MNLSLLRKTAFVFAVFLLSVFLSSCVTPTVRPPSPHISQARPYPAVPAPRGDIVHIVAPGETLWRLSKMYDVSIQDISRANRIDLNNPILEKGQRVLIPHAAPVMPVISLYPSKKWQYIIIHHSATDGGSSLSFDSTHETKGWGGVGYHFIINNGSKGKVDGQIEVSPRWLKQQEGAHCKAGGMNYKAIGICLVGNFSNETPTRRQMDSLVYLTNELRRYYKIPVDRVKGHGQVSGAKTECPGRNFPWREFKGRLR
ncbi:MAG: LysM peptidoglycan-binding domain-containing protein [Candidatus Omnitrophica bacterium]|nr:LysM peptidoglycan-binding domain-containing protein [Candidatus Omnitrophota bacterium]